MIAAWMMYTIAVSLLAGLAALALERAMRLLHLPGRWAWASAVVASVGLPLWARLRPVEAAADRMSIALPPVIDGELLLELLGAANRSSAIATMDAALIVLWVGSSILMSAVLASSQLKIRREARAGPIELFGGVSVRVTPTLGPAVVGGFPSVILLPAWVRRLDPDWQDLVVSHEREHLRAGDERLLLAGLVVAVLVPWNIPLWWQLRRLRDAVELDCDGRVVRNGVNALHYSELLLEVARRVGARRSPTAFLAPTLSHPKSLLARRIQMMTQGTPRARWPRAGVAVAAAMLLTALACETPMPAALEIDSELGTATLVSQVASEAVVDVHPTRQSGPLPRYPEMLRQAGIEGTVLLAFVIDAGGTVDAASINVLESSNRAFEGPAKEAITRSIYTPGEIGGEPVAVQVEQRIGFSSALNRNVQALQRQDVQTLQHQIESALSRRVRDTSLVDGRESPLLYVDGVRVSGEELSALARKTIARVEVIKGAAAVSLYGEEAVVGVVQIFTKKDDIAVTGRRVNR